MTGSAALHMGVAVCKKENGGWFYVQEFSDNPDAKATLTLNTDTGTFPTLNNAREYNVDYPLKMRIRTSSLSKTFLHS